MFNDLIAEISDVGCSIQLPLKLRSNIFLVSVITPSAREETLPETRENRMVHRSSRQVSPPES